MKYLFTLVFCLTSMLALSQGAGIRIVDSIPVDTPVINNYQALKVFNTADHQFYSWQDSAWTREGSEQDSLKVGFIEDSLDYDRIILEPGQRLALADTSGYESFLLYPDGKIVFGNNVVTPTYFFEVYSQAYYNDLINFNDNWFISGGADFQVKPWSSDAVGSFVIEDRSNTERFQLDIDGDLTIRDTTNTITAQFLAQNGLLIDYPAYIEFDYEDSGTRIERGAAFGDIDISLGAGPGDLRVFETDDDLRFAILSQGALTLLDTSGTAALTVGATGTVTTVAGTVYDPSATANIVAGTGLTSAMIAYTIVAVAGSGGPVDISADPQIANGTDGQIIYIRGTSDTNTVTFDDGTGLQLDGGASAVLGVNDVLTLAYLGSDWIEISRTNN